MFSRTLHLEPDKYALTKNFHFDFTTSYVFDNLKKWKANLRYLANNNLIKKLSPTNLMATALFNIASGHWVVLRFPFDGKATMKAMLERDPEDTLAMSYLTIVPRYLPDLVTGLRNLQDAVDTRDYDTAKRSIDKMMAVIVESTMDVPPPVRDFVRKLPKISDIVKIIKKDPTYDFPTNRDIKTFGRKKTFGILRKDVTDAQIVETFGKYLKYQSTGRGITWSKKKACLDEEVDL